MDILLACALFFCTVVAAFSQTKALFYMTSEPASVRSFLANTAKIDIVGPQVYSADGTGLVWGGVEPTVLEAARRHNLAVMPLIVNPGFRQETIHKLLNDPAARTRLSKTLLEECRRYQYYGIQFDFENIPYSDRDLLTSLVRETAELLGRENFKLSIATVHKSSEYPGYDGYAHWIYSHWRGVFDLAEIAKHVDFISVMTYDQHTGRTPPGPVAGFPWVLESLEYTLSVVPKEKVSLGIPLYGRRWYAGTRESDADIMLRSINYPDAVELAAQWKVKPQWDPEERAPWFYFYRDGVREYVFYNDARSFRERYRLARDRRLHSFSAWVLGAEDPDIWKDLPIRK